MEEVENWHEITHTDEFGWWSIDDKGELCFFENCLECHVNLTEEEFDKSTEDFEVPLCSKHLSWAKKTLEKTTEQNLILYFFLKLYLVPVEIEVFDGNKTVDLSIERCKVHIEVDGVHHNTNPKQALADLKRTYHSFVDGYYTIRVPNVLITSYELIMNVAMNIQGIAFFRHKEIQKSLTKLERTEHPFLMPAFMLEEDSSDNPKYTFEDKRKLHANAYRIWTSDDDKKLKRLYKDEKSISQLIKIFERNRGGIKARIKKLNLMDSKLI